MTPFHPHEPDTALMQKPGQQRQSLWRQFAALWAFGLREYRLWQSYRVNQVLWMTNILVTTLLFFLLGQTIASQAAALLGPAYGTNYMSFVVIGVTVNVFIATNLSDPFFRIQRSYFTGTMDLFLLSPMSIYTPLLGLMARSVLDDYPRLFFTFGFGMLLFGATFNFTFWPLSLLFTVLFLAAGFGMGMLSASSFYLLDIKRGTEPIQFVIQQLLATLLAGTYYPITVLPTSLQCIACLITHTYANDALRRLLCPGAQSDVPVLPIQHVFSGISPVLIDGVALTLFTVILLPLGVFAYGRGIERARRNGTLTRWQ
jgi:ABC-2 type transport system permease protein